MKWQEQVFADIILSKKRKNQEQQLFLLYNCCTTTTTYIICSQRHIFKNIRVCTLNKKSKYHFPLSFKVNSLFLYILYSPWFLHPNIVLQPGRQKTRHWEVIAIPFWAPTQSQGLLLLFPWTSTKKCVLLGAGPLLTLTAWSLEAQKGHPRLLPTLSLAPLRSPPHGWAPNETPSYPQPIYSVSLDRDIPHARYWAQSFAVPFSHPQNTPMT